MKYFSSKMPTGLYLELYFNFLSWLWMFWAISSCYETSLDGPDKDTASSSSYQLHPDLWENSLGSWYGEGHGLLLVWSSSIDAHLALGKATALTDITQGFLRGTLWHSSKSRHPPLKKPNTWEPNNIFNNYRLDINWHVRHCDLIW